MITRLSSASGMFGGKNADDRMLLPSNITMAPGEDGGGELAENIWKIGSPILVTLGLVGNTLSALVMRRKKMQTSVTSVYLLVLAFSDSCVLLVALVYNWMSYGYHVDIQKYSNFTCKVHKMLLFSCIHFEAWVLVSVTLERLAAVAFPFRAKTYFTRARARLGMIITGLVILGLNAHFLWDTSVRETPSGRRCTYKPAYGGFCGIYSKVWSFVDLIISSLLPFSAMLVMNSMIIGTLYKSTKFRRHQNESLKVTAKTGSVRFDPSCSAGGQNTTSARPMAVLLLTVTFLFIILSLPICVLILLGKKRTCKASSFILNTDELEELITKWAVVNIVAYTNNSVNFFLYFLSGRRFRRELWKMLCACACRRKSQNSFLMADIAERKL